MAARHPESRFAMMFNQRANPLPQDLKQLAELLRNFAGYILGGVPLIAPGAGGIHNARLANAMQLSAWTNADIDLTVSTTMPTRHT